MVKFSKQINFISTKKTNGFLPKKVLNLQIPKEFQTVRESILAKISKLLIHKELLAKSNQMNKLHIQTMKYLKYTQYIYLVAAIIFGIRAAEIWDKEKDQAYLFLGIAILSIFMFFFRRKFAKKFEDRNSKP
jgi:hypothetical protein